MRVSWLLLAGLAMAACSHKEPEPEPPAPAPTGPPVRTLDDLRFTPGFYRGIVDEGAKKWGVPSPSDAELAAPLVDTVELETPTRLAPGKSVETGTLRLAVKKVPLWAPGGRSDAQRYEYPHLVLAITNVGKSPVAYRVDTTIPGGRPCGPKGVVAHNAIALAPGETAERTECLWRAPGVVEIDRVEVLALTPLGYHYVSHLDPLQIGLDARTAAGHAVAPDGQAAMCRYVPWRDIEDDHAAWRDVIDFYARHDCAEYAFFPGYRFRTSVAPLPARAPGR